ncbi:hypothetical protein [Butyricicoccus sp. AM78-15b2TA]|uniref:hypothetical protein n=1 Tax=Butyricicoccus sp. AM78-15b2TA TaxID=3002516 RepID=UPI0022E4060B|nr:hypothetical protein [Butyricicoccus sp. AM78-15b2TA]
MKKLTAMLLALTLCFGLAACGGNTAQDDTKDESQTVQTGKTEDKKDEAKTEEKSDETKTEDAKTETGDKTSTDSKTEDKTNETKPVTSSTNTTTAKPSGSAGTSKPSASTSKPAASAPESKPAQSKPAASAPAETKPAEPAKPTASQASGYVGSSASALESALGAPTSKSYSPSCMGEGEDGIWTYDGFTVYTYKEGGSETVEAVQ